MMFQWGDKNAPKFLSLVYGKEWDKEDIKLFSFRNTPLGWDLIIWRFVLSYDNFEKVSK